MFERLNYCLQKYKNNLYAILSTKLKVKLNNSIDPTLTNETPGVSLIPVTTNEDKKGKLFYIRMITQKFKLHLKEHISNIKFDFPARHNHD